MKMVSLTYQQQRWRRERKRQFFRTSWGRTSQTASRTTIPLSSRRSRSKAVAAKTTTTQSLAAVLNSVNSVKIVPKRIRHNLGDL